MRLRAQRAWIDEAFQSATIDVVDGRVHSVSTAPGEADLTFPTGYLVPGFVDAHCHGGGGAAFTNATDVSTAVATHRSRGVTTLMASLVTDDEYALRLQLDALAPFVSNGDLAGVHLEGPWLSTAYRGAHPEAQLTDPALDIVARLVERHLGLVRMVTIAPELPGALDAIAWLRAHDVVVAVGHTGADYRVTRAAIEAGATGATHLFNAMPPLLHREPGPVLALLDDERVFIELIMDGVHVHTALAAHVMRTVGERACLITDAMAAAGAEDGRYELGRLSVQVVGGVARVAGTDTIAGSTLTMDQALRNAVAAGVGLPQAIAAVTSSPARYLGLQDVGSIAVGKRADFVHLNDDLHVVQVIRNGEFC